MSIELLIFIFLAVVFNTVSKILDRHVAKDTVPYAFSWLTQITGAVFMLILALPNLTFPKSNFEWFIILFAGSFWTIVSVSSYTAIKKTEVSIKEPLYQSKLIWILLFGFLFLGENITTTKILGTLVFFIGISIVLFHPERKFGRLTDPGVLWTLGTAMLVAIISIVDKFALSYFSPASYGFFIYLIPTIILTGFLPKKIKDVKHLWGLHGKIAMTTILFATASYYFTLKAFSLAEITNIYPLLQLATVLAVIAGITFMGEREHTWQKIIGTIVVVIGAIIVKS